MSDLFEKMIEYFAAFWTDPGNLFLFFPFFKIIFFMQSRQKMGYFQK